MERIKHIGEHPNIQSFVRTKLELYEKQEKNYKTLFEMMFSEKENIMAEVSDGYHIKKTTYGQFRQWILEVAPAVRQALGDPQKDTIVGIYMANSMEWLAVFWSVLLCGCRPLLMNTRLDSAVLEQLLQEHPVHAVISDGKTFPVKTLLAEDILVRGEPMQQLGEFGSEVIFMSSGTSEHLKLCAYTGENFYYQVRSSLDIVTKCPDIAAHYEGEIKQLMLLPLYHVFGFMAVYLWIGFFSRTFVFLKDMNPSTILNTVRKHKVTHIFAVPMVWEAVHREAVRKIKARSDATYRKFCKFLNICNRTGKLGTWLAKRAFREVREASFGDSVKCMISGGSPIADETLAFFNGIGYPLFNGYGMTEVGITSVETSRKKRIRNKGAVGVPFDHVQYQLTPSGQLLIRSHARAAKIVSGGCVYQADYDEWFDSRDIARVEKGRFYLGGRADDLIVCENGENINPVLSEKKLGAEGCKQLCLFQAKSGPVLIAYAPDCCTDEMLQSITLQLRGCLQQAKLADEVKKIAITSTPLMGEAEFKISRRAVARKYESGEFFILTPHTMDTHRQQLRSQLEQQLCRCFARALGKQDEEIGVNDDFFGDLGGTSLDYFMLKDDILEQFSVDITAQEQAPTTVAACSQLITKKKVDLNG